MALDAAGQSFVWHVSVCTRRILYKISIHTCPYWQLRHCMKFHLSCVHIERWHTVYHFNLQGSKLRRGPTHEMPPYRFPYWHVGHLNTSICTYAYWNETDGTNFHLRRVQNDTWRAAGIFNRHVSTTTLGVVYKFSSDTCLNGHLPFCTNFHLTGVHIHSRSVQFFIWEVSIYWDVAYCTILDLTPADIDTSSNVHNSLKTIIRIWSFYQAYVYNGKTRNCRPQVHRNR